MNNQEIIDLQKSNQQFEQILEQVQQQVRQVNASFKPLVNQLKLIFQFQGTVPQTYTLDITQMIVQCQLFGSQKHIIINEDFYLPPMDFYQVFNKFIAFLYSGKLKYSNLDYLIYIKLSLYFECQELYVELSCKVNKLGLNRSFFLPVFIYLLNHPMFGILELQHRNHFTTEMILANTDYFSNYKFWTEVRIQKARLAFASITPIIFEKFAIILKGYDKIDELTQLLCEINENNNPQISKIEMIYIERIVEIVDSEFLDKYSTELTKPVKRIFDKIVHKDNEIVYHFIQSKICNMHKRYFMSSCGHMTCLNCFLEYFLYKITTQLQIDGICKTKCKIKCISRYIDHSICKQAYNLADFKQLEKFVPSDLLQIYVK